MLPRSSARFTESVSFVETRVLRRVLMPSRAVRPLGPVLRASAPVLLERNQLQVIRAHASSVKTRDAACARGVSVVARVIPIHSSRRLAHKEVMGLAYVAKVPVAIWVHVASPKPARLGFSHLFPKALFGRLQQLWSVVSINTPVLAPAQGVHSAPAQVMRGFLAILDSANRAVLRGAGVNSLWHQANSLVSTRTAAPTARPLSIVFDGGAK